jgi:hypothetical protein
VINTNNSYKKLLSTLTEEPVVSPENLFGFENTAYALLPEFIARLLSSTREPTDLNMDQTSIFNKADYNKAKRPPA